MLRFRRSKESKPQTVETSGRSNVKVTLWLSGEIVKKLDSYWLKCRKDDQKATKSKIVSEALEKFLKGKGF
jgi:hypothetical protein